MKDWILKVVFSSPKWTGGLVFLASLSVTLFLSFVEYKLHLSQERELVTNKLYEFENQLASALNDGISAAKTLAFFVQNNEEVSKNFEDIGRQILESNPQVDVIQLLDSGTIVSVYPLQGNEAVLGYNVLNDPKNNKEVEEAILRKEVYFSGPIELKQGGIGIVGRYPLFEEGKFVGLSAVIIHFDKLVQKAFLYNKKEDIFEVQLSKVNPNTGLLEKFVTEVDSEKYTGHLASLPVDVGNWILSVQLKESQVHKELIKPLLLRTLFSILFSFLVWNFARQPSLLIKKLNEKSKEIILANERFEMATRATSDAIWDWNLETNEKYRSSQFSVLFGYSQKQLGDNKQFRTDLIHPEDLERVKIKLRETLSGNTNFWEIEFRGLKADQTYAYISEKGYIIRNEQGKAIRMIGATQDITRQKTDELKLIKANERFEFATRATSDVIWDWDLESHYVYRSDQFTTMFGYHDQEMVSRDSFWSSLIHPEDFEKVEKDLTETLKGSGQIWQREFRVKRADGTYAFIIDKGYILRDSDGKPYRMIGSIQDISLRKENELKLREANQRLSNANEELKAFASMASHDMREPLRMISSFMSLLEKKYGPNLDEKARQYISFAIDGAKRLTQLIHDLLDYSKVGFDPNLIEEINTKELVQEVLALKSALIQENNATLIIEELPNIKGVQMPLRILFQNLIGNALKYQKPDTNPEIRISGKEEKDFWKFSIKDNGIGIEADYLEVIFGILKRLHSKEKYPGAGMGLAVCRKIILQHGGKIWAESTPGIGTEFFFTIKKHE